MRHGAKSRQLSRTSKHRRAMLNNMATSLLAHDRIGNQRLPHQLRDLLGRDYRRGGFHGQGRAALCQAHREHAGKAAGRKSSARSVASLSGTTAVISRTPMPMVWR